MAHTEVFFVPVGEKRAHAARQIRKYDLLALPVLDDRDTLVGTITREHTEPPSR